jgi:hypothetical protein
MNWRPRIWAGVVVGIAIFLLIAVADALLVWRIVRGPPNGLTFLMGACVLVSLAAMAVIAYRVYDLTRLRYEMDRNRLLIVRAGSRHVVPLKEIEQAVEIGQLGLKARFRGLRWPGYALGRGAVEEIGLVRWNGVDPPCKQLLIVTPVLAYGISVLDLDVFCEVYVACKRLGATAEVQHKSVQAPFLHRPIWRDRAAHVLVLAGITMAALLFAVLLFRYPGLPDRLPMHYDAAGQVDRIAARSKVFALPVIGLIAWATNGMLGTLFYRRQRMLSYLAWSGTLIVQVLFLMALWDIVS